MPPVNNLVDFDRNFDNKVEIESLLNEDKLGKGKDTSGVHSLITVEGKHKSDMSAGTGNNLSRTKFQQLVFCFLGIFGSYFVYGLLQENITKKKYGEGGERFTYMSAMVFVQCIVNAAAAYIAIRVSRPPKDSSPQSLYAVMSFSYLFAMLASNNALKYVNYPTQVIGKSVKPIPVMILGVIMARKRYPLVKYIFVLLIVLGIIMFMYQPGKTSKAAVSSSGESDDEEFHTIGFGEFLLVLSLFCDGVTGGVQDKLRAEHRPQTHRMMLWMNVWSIFYLSIGLQITGESVDFLSFVMKYPSVLWQLLSFSVCSAIGQHFIFRTISLFGPLTCSIITTTRKFFTILCSVFYFSHPMSAIQWMGTILVFLGLTLDSMYGKERRRTA